jgi:class 3 adenylate cyclase
VFLQGKIYDFIQEMYEILGDIVVEKDGELIKYMGDAILSIFPENSEGIAVECAREMRHAYENILTKYDITVESELQIGIGSGTVAMGTFGHNSLLMKDVFGETVNETAIILHHKGITITNDVYEKVKQKFKLTKLEDQKLSWREKPLEIWEVHE